MWRHETIKIPTITMTVMKNINFLCAQRKHMGECRYSSTHTYPLQSMNVSDQLHATDDLFPGTITMTVIIIIIIIINVSTIPGNHYVRELQKTAILGTAHTLRKVLM
jgi:hypothetical protein